MERFILGSGGTLRPKEASPTTDNIRGLRIVRNFITAAEEKALLEQIDHSTWNRELARRTQHYGQRYSYADRQLYLAPPLPEWLSPVLERIHEKVDEFPRTAAAATMQVIVNEYEPGQGIADHTDHVGLFGPTVVSLSLSSATTMDFGTKGRADKISVRLQPRDLLVLTGDARYRWTHGIRPRIVDTVETSGGERRRLRRGRRVSITFRTISSSPQHHGTDCCS